MPDIEQLKKEQQDLVNGLVSVNQKIAQNFATIFVDALLKERQGRKKFKYWLTEAIRRMHNIRDRDNIWIDLGRNFNLPDSVIFNAIATVSGDRYGPTDRQLLGAINSQIKSFGARLYLRADEFDSNMRILHRWDVEHLH